jgi:RNA polymerase sigma factor (sigma-70 family)
MRVVSQSDLPCRTLAETAEDFESLRSRLIGIAFRVLRRSADAEDVVQDVWIRWQGANRAEVRDRAAFLVTVTKRAALNAATSARARREVISGSELQPRDVADVDPAAEAERGEELQHAIHLLFERLSPAERAVYVLREAFDYPFRDIAEELQLSEAHARQLALRARKHVTEHRATKVDLAARNGLLQGFLGAARAGETEHLIRVLAATNRSGG